MVLSGRCTYLLVRHRISDQTQIHQFLEPSKGVQIRQLRNPVLGQDQRRQVRYRGREVGLDGGDAVLCEEEGAQARGEGEVAQVDDVIVCEVDGVVILHVLHQRDFLEYGRRRLVEGIKGALTRAAPIFSMADILCPSSRKVDINGALQRKCSICSFQTHLVNRVHAPSGS